MAHKKLMPNLEYLSKEQKLITDLKSSIENLMKVDLFKIQNASSITEEISLVWLLARHGLSKIVNICCCWNKLPSTLTKLQRVRYITEYTKVPENEVKDFVAFIQSSCPSLLDTLAGEQDDPIVLAPPVSHCLQCGNQLVSYHTCKVRYYTEQRAMLVDKVTLRCMGCKLLYNITQYGNKSDLGFRFYPKIGETVEATDTVYAKRSLLEFQCALA